MSFSSTTEGLVKILDIMSNPTTVRLYTEYNYNEETEEHEFTDAPLGSKSISWGDAAEYGTKSKQTSSVATFEASEAHENAVNGVYVSGTCQYYMAPFGPIAIEADSIFSMIFVVTLEAGGCV